METGEREFGVVDPAEDEVPLPAVEPLTGVEPDETAEEERNQTWGPGRRPSGADTAGGA